MIKIPHIIKRSVTLAWKYKILWLIAIFANPKMLTLNAQPAKMQTPRDTIDYRVERQNDYKNENFETTIKERSSPPAVSTFGDLLENEVLGSTAQRLSEEQYINSVQNSSTLVNNFLKNVLPKILLMFIVVTSITYIIRTIFKAALISGTYKVYKNEKITLIPLIKENIKKIKQIFIVDIKIGLTIFFWIVAPITLAVLIQYFVRNPILTLVASLVLGVVIIIKIFEWSIFQTYAYRFLILKEENSKNSIKSAKNLKPFNKLFSLEIANFFVFFPLITVLGLFSFLGVFSYILKIAVMAFYTSYVELARTGLFLALSENTNEISTDAPLQEQTVEHENTSFDDVELNSDSTDNAESDTLPQELDSDSTDNATSEQEINNQLSEQKDTSFESNVPDQEIDK